MTVEDITDRIESRRKEEAMDAIYEVLENHSLTRLEALGMLEICKMNMYTEWQIQDHGDEDD